MGLTKDYSLANLLVVPVNKRKFIVFGFFFQTHLFHSILELDDVLFHYLLTFFCSECWCNGLLRRISFT